VPGAPEAQAETLFEPFVGLTHDEVLASELPEGPRCLVDDLVEVGTVGTYAGIPET
jgi:hypothetical protein